MTKEHHLPVQLMGSLIDPLLRLGEPTSIEHISLNVAPDRFAVVPVPDGELWRVISLTHTGFGLRVTVRTTFPNVDTVTHDENHLFDLTTANQSSIYVDGDAEEGRLDSYILLGNAGEYSYLSIENTGVISRHISLLVQKFDVLETVSRSQALLHFHRGRNLWEPGYSAEDGSTAHAVDATRARATATAVQAERTWVTPPTYFLTHVSEVHIDWELSGGGTPEAFVAVGTHGGDHATAVASEAFPAVDIGNRITTVFDVSGVTGHHYIRFHVVQSTVGQQAELLTRRVWLE